MRVAIIGGTGNMGGALARRAAATGHEVVIGSRDAGRAHRAAVETSQGLGLQAHVTASVTAHAADGCELVILAVPYVAHGSVLESLARALRGSVLLDVCEAIGTPPAHRFSGGDLSAAEEARVILNNACPVVGGFTNLWDRVIADLDREVEDTAFICGDDAEAKLLVTGFARSIGLHPLDAGPLERMRIVEQLTGEPAQATP